ncbi:MAG: TVP38/TMEM64 family protein [Candidatus Tectomicrobia bacterium]|nr:TVP38/TMEM64 family protein [Candidatus Tectomicrobia bacterium]
MPVLMGRAIRLGLLLGLAGLILLIGLKTPLGEVLWSLLTNPSSEAVQELVANTPTWLPFAIVGLMILHTLVPVPAEFLALAAGMTLGPFWGFVTIWIGAMLGAYLGFWLTRAFGRPVLRLFVSPSRLERSERWLQQIDVPVLLAVRLLPVLSFNLINFALGLTAISWWRFSWTTALGIVPATVLMVAFGAHLDDWRMLALMSAAAALLCLGGYVMMRRRRAKEQVVVSPASQRHSGVCDH